MRALFFAIALAAGLTTLPAGAAWPPLSDVYAQAPKGRDGGERPERPQGAQGAPAARGAQGAPAAQGSAPAAPAAAPGAPAAQGVQGAPVAQPRPDRRPEQAERRERLNQDERKALHRDLDKANREIYQRPSPQ